ncbi:MAG: hypothetical protein ACTHYC_12705 [Sphingobacterium sp.]
MNIKIRFWQNIFLPVLVFVVSAQVVSSLLYACILLTWNINLPHWSQWVIPLLLSLSVLAIFRKRLFGPILTGQRLIERIHISEWLLMITLPVIAAVLFSPLAKSLRFNFGYVKTISSINELAPYQDAVFLEVSDWHVDRMRVIPIQTYRRSGLFNLGKIELNSLFIVPVFSKENAYQTHARAWLAFNYTDRISAKAFAEGRGEEFYRSSLVHFKRRNVREFRYLEAYPRGEEYDTFQQMARAHDYYKSGFSGIYQGQEIDRDVLSAHYWKYALFHFILIGLPLMLGLSMVIYFWLTNRGKSMRTV